MSNAERFTLRSTHRFLYLIFLVILAIALVAAMSLLLLKPAKAAPAAQVGVGTAGRNAFEFIGRIDQNDADFTGYGYLTYIKGLDNADIYTDPFNPSEEMARFTYVATATLTSRAVLTDVFALDSQGTITFYFSESPGSRSFDNPASFASGTPIATASMRYQDILLVQSANKGIATGVSEMKQLSAPTFILNYQSYQFGEPGLLYRLSTSGNGTRTSLVPLNSFVLLAGNAVTSGQETYIPAVLKD